MDLNIWFGDILSGYVAGKSGFRGDNLIVSVVGNSDIETFADQATDMFFAIKVSAKQPAKVLDPVTLGCTSVEHW